jgi:hypothetical protein
MAARELDVRFVASPDAVRELLDDLDDEVRRLRSEGSPDEERAMRRIHAARALNSFTGDRDAWDRDEYCRTMVFEAACATSEAAVLAVLVEKLSEPDHLPIGFPIYGLAAEWTGPRWLAFAEGELGREATAIALDHGFRPAPARGHAWVRVRTESIASRSAKIKAGAFDWMQDTAMRAVLTAVEVMRSELPDEHARHFGRNTLIYVQRRAARYGSWAPATWTIDSESTPVRFTRFAGAWAAYVAEPRDDIVVSAVGYGVPVQGLHLSRVTTGEDYHFDLHAPITSHEVYQRSAAAALGPYAEDWVRPPRRHRDLDRLAGAILATSPREKAANGLCAAPGCEKQSVVSLHISRPAAPAFGTRWKAGDTIAACAEHRQEIPPIAGMTLKIERLSDGTERSNA